MNPDGTESPVPPQGVEGHSSATVPLARSRVRLYILIAAVLLLAVVVGVGLYGGQPPQGRVEVYNGTATSDMAAALARVPSDYLVGTRSSPACGLSGCLSTASASFGKPESLGSTGVSARIVVFNTSTAAGADYASAVGVVESKSGFTDISSSLGAYSEQGKCFGAGVGTSTGSTITVYCTKGNVLFGVDFNSTLSLDGLRAEVPDVLGAVYSGIA